MLHIMLITLHAVSGLVALVAGTAILSPSDRHIPPLFQFYLGALWAMVVFLLLVVAFDWPSLETSSRVLFGGLAAFAVVIGWSGWRARQHLSQRAPGWHRGYLENVGFTLISLFDAFVIVAALDLGAPVWLIVLLGVLGVLIGRLGIRQFGQQLAIQ